jgi:hypothetical protein
MIGTVHAHSLIDAAISSICENDAAAHWACTG